jgi:hypothetical protein
MTSSARLISCLRGRTNNQANGRVPIRQYSVQQKAVEPEKGLKTGF